MARRFPLGVQLTVPDAYRTSNGFRRTLEVAAAGGLSELELGVVDLQAVEPAELLGFVKGFGLTIARIASGAFAKSHGLSLSALEEGQRQKAVAGCVEILRYAGALRASVIIGLFKGPPEGASTQLRERFERSLVEVAHALANGPIRLIVEATNRYETAVANTLEEAASLTAPYVDRGMRILPDTFHIEESNRLDALRRFKDRYTSLHISDNNRLLPGFGEFDFRGLFRFLGSISYAGSLVMEGNSFGVFREDLKKSIGLWTICCRKAERPGGMACRSQPGRCEKEERGYEVRDAVRVLGEGLERGLPVFC